MDTYMPTPSPLTTSVWSFIWSLKQSVYKDLQSLSQDKLAAWLIAVFLVLVLSKFCAKFWWYKNITSSIKCWKLISIQRPLFNSGCYRQNGNIDPSRVIITQYQKLSRIIKGVLDTDIEILPGKQECSRPEFLFLADKWSWRELNIAEENSPSLRENS